MNTYSTVELATYGWYILTWVRYGQKVRFWQDIDINDALSQEEVKGSKPSP